MNFLTWFFWYCITLIAFFAAVPWVILGLDWYVVYVSWVLS